VFVSQVYLHPRGCSGTFCFICLVLLINQEKIDPFLNSFKGRFTNRYDRREIK